MKITILRSNHRHVAAIHVYVFRVVIAGIELHL
jgi:hypothetical protein